MNIIQFKMKKNNRIKPFQYQTQYQNFVLNLINSNHFNSEENLVLEFIHEQRYSKDFVCDINFRIDEEKLATWIEDKAKKAKKIIINGKEKVNQGIEILSKFGQSFSNYITLIVKNIQDFLQKSWKYLYATITSELESNKIELLEKIKTRSFDNIQLQKEVGQFKAMSKGGIEYLTSGILKEMENAFKKTGSEDIKECLIFAISESIQDKTITVNEIFSLNESENSLPFISKIAHKISHYPPFSWLHSFEETVSEHTNNTFNKVSEWLTKRGSVAGVYEFVIIGSVAGLIAGHFTKHSIVDIVKEIGMSGIGSAIVTTIPAIGFLLMVMKIIAKGIWIVQILETSNLALSQTNSENK